MDSIFVAQWYLISGINPRTKSTETGLFTKQNVLCQDITALLVFIEYIGVNIFKI